MHEIKIAFINEIEKMYKKKKAIVVVILSLLVIVFGQLAIFGVRAGLGLRGAGGNEFPILVLSFFANLILPLFTALVAIDAFSGEFSHNTMKIALLRPITRVKLFTGKLFAISFFILVNLFVVMILSIIAGLIFDASTITFAGIFKIFISYIATFLPSLVLALGIVLLANFFAGGASVFFFSILLFLAFKVLGVLFSQYSGVLLTSYLGWYNLWIAENVAFTKILRQFLMMLGYGIVFFTVGFYLFDKKEY